jgi:hypothetical protein
MYLLNELDQKALMNLIEGNHTSLSSVLSCSVLAFDMVNNVPIFVRPVTSSILTSTSQAEALSAGGLLGSIE